MSLLLTLLFRRLVPTPTAAFHRDSNPRPQLLRVSSNHSAKLAIEVEVGRDIKVQRKVQMKMILPKQDMVKRLLLLQLDTQVPEEEDQKFLQK
jgi:hypothetical protein